MIDKLKHHWNVSSRREFFTQAGSGLAGMALASMLAETGYAGAGVALDPSAAQETAPSRRRRSRSSSCSWKAGRAMSICSTPSRC